MSPTMAAMLCNRQSQPSVAMRVRLDVCQCVSIATKFGRRSVLMAGYLSLLSVSSTLAGTIYLVGPDANQGPGSGNQPGAAGLAGSGGTGGGASQSNGGIGANGVINSGTPGIGAGQLGNIGASTITLLTNGGTSTTPHGVTLDAFALGGGSGGRGGGGAPNTPNNGTAGTYTLSGAVWDMNTPFGTINPTNLTVGGGGGGGGSGFNAGNGGPGGAGGGGTLTVTLGAQLNTLAAC